MQSQWDWLLNLSKCLEVHLQDALNLRSVSIIITYAPLTSDTGLLQFMEEAQNCENWMERQSELLESHFNRSDFSLEEGERYLKELDEIKVLLDNYYSVLMSLIERSSIISPLWQRGERIARPITVTALADYNDRNVSVLFGLDNLNIST